MMCERINRAFQKTARISKISLCIFAFSLNCTAFARSLILPESHFQIQNTQSTITLPEYTTSLNLIRPRPDVKDHEGLLKQCEYFPTPKLRQLCERIAGNPIIVAMKENVRGHLKEIPWNKSVTKSDAPMDGQTECPDYSRSSPYVQPRDRSLSPWKNTDDYDHHRYPQHIHVVKCLCKGCIDQRSGKENKSFVSQEIKVKVRFLRMNSTLTAFQQCTDTTCYASDEDIALGCHCAIPVEV